jgi:hypothetical protein
MKNLKNLKDIYNKCFLKIKKWLLINSCLHVNASPVSSPIPEHTEYYCPDCDIFYLEAD